MGNERRITCPYHQSKYDAFHDVCPLNGERECEQYQVIEKHLKEVDQAYGEFQRGAYIRPPHQKRIPCPYNESSKDRFHDICPFNGKVECEGYQLLERRLDEVDKAYGQFQRDAYVRE